MKIEEREIIMSVFRKETLRIPEKERIKKEYYEDNLEKFEQFKYSLYKGKQLKQQFSE